MFVNFFTAVIEISITTSFVIALLLIISPITKKTYAARWRYFVWLILAIRLSIPYNIALPTPPVTLTTPNDTIIYRQPTNTTTEIPQTQTINQINTPISVLNTQNKNISLMELLTIVWLIGILFFILYHLIVYISFKKQVKRWSSEIVSSEIISIFDTLCNDFMIKRKPKLKLCKKINSPMMFGFVKPVLLLPSENYNLNDLQVILKHELVHYIRKDLWYKLILLFANSIHWFNPFVYFMLKSANSDVELSCDNEVIRDSDIAFRKSYSQTILATLHNEKMRQSALSTYLNGSKKTMKNRFENIFDMGKRRKGVISLCVVLMVTIISGVFVACRSDNTQGKTVSELLFSNKTAYAGDNSKVVAIIDLLSSSAPTNIKRDMVSIETGDSYFISQGNAITINYTSESEILSTPNDNEWLIKNAIIMFSLIDTLGKIDVNIINKEPVDTQTFEITRSEAEEYFGGNDLTEFAKTLESFKSFLAKVDGMNSTISENTPFKGLELYVWRNKTVTGNDDTYFTLLFGTNRNKTVDEIYDLAAAVNDIDKINEMLAEYSDETYLFIYQMNTTDFTKDEMLEISNKLKLNSNDYSKSIGLYQTTGVNVINDIPVETENIQFRSMEEAIHDALIKHSQKAYLTGEFSAEGHIIVYSEEIDIDVKVYAVVATQNFQFMNGFLVNAGSGVHPVVITLLRADKGSYEFLELKEPMDGGMWEESIKEIYPEKLWYKVTPLSTKLSKYSNDISRQINNQAEAYLESIGRDAEIKEYSEIGIKSLDIDGSASNKLDELRKYDMEFNKYPYWIGTQEWVENGTRYIYETYQSKSMEGVNIIGFKKTNEKGDTVDHFQYKVVNGNVERIDNTDTKYSTEANFLNSVEGVAFQAVTYKAATAFLSADS